MTAAGKLSYLPVAIPMRTVASEYNRPQRQTGTPQTWQHRIYRLPPRERPDAFSYFPSGHAATAPAKGTVIDLYV